MAQVDSRWSLKLLGFWQLLRAGARMDVGPRQQRVITLLALLGARPRRVVAGRLWPESTDARAEANLRAALYRISHEQPGLIRSSSDILELEPAVDVDLVGVHAMIDDVLAGADREPPASLGPELRAAELLPGWDDDWVVAERDRLDVQRMSALDAIARRHLKSGDPVRAIDAATVSIAIEPLRESAHFLLMQAHVDSGNHALAAQLYQRFSELLAAELGVNPSVRFAALLDSRPSP